MSSTPQLVGSLSAEDVTRLEYVGAGLVAFIVFLVAARVIAHFLGDQLHRRNVRADMVVLGRRVVYVVVIGFGVLAAFSFSLQTANVTLVGILLATVIAALGVQDLLRDYISGYYVLLERHIRIGDRISFDDQVGTVTDVRLRVTMLRSDSGDLMVIPNSELFNKPVTIFVKPATDAAASSAPPG